MIEKVPLSELKSRLKRFVDIMNADIPQWKFVFVFSKLNMYYFTGTMQEGMLIIVRDEEPQLWVRRSYERAIDESEFPFIYPMTSFRDAAANFQLHDSIAYIEAEIIPIGFLERFQKYFPFTDLIGIDYQISYVRSVKSEYELKLMRKSGEIHRRVLEDLVPGMLREGMNEAELAGELYNVMIKEGHHGIARFSMFDTDIGIGQLGFGVSSIYPSFFNGPGGNYGMYPAMPFIGSRSNILKKGDLVFLDVACGYYGYHTDKTMTYMFGNILPEYVIKTQNQCVEIQNQIAEMLRPGNLPSMIYDKIMGQLDNDFLENFMGFGNKTVKFLGHGIGLSIDEYPVIAKGFDRPLEKNMVLAVEPKKGIENIGMVGIENTFIVTENGGECITGNNIGLIPVF